MLCRGEQQQRLTLKAAEVLRRLAEQAGGVVTRERLIAEVWQGNAYTGARGLTYTIWQLRKALRHAEGGALGAADADADEAAPPRGASDHDDAIETISKTGYRLLLPVVAPAARAGNGASRRADDAAERSGPRLAEPVWHSSQARMLWVLTLVLGLALVVALGFAVRRLPQPVLPADTDRSRPLRAITTQDGVESAASYSRDGRRLAYTWQKLGISARLRVVDPEAASETPLEFADPEAPVVRPVWLDAERIAYVRGLDGEGCRVVELDLRSGVRRDLAACFYQRGLQALDVSPDGKWIAFARRRPEDAAIGIVLQRLADGQERWLTQPPAGADDGWIAWSHDGRSIGFVRGSSDTVSEVFVVDVASGQERQLTHAQAPVWGLAWLEGDRALAFNAVLGDDLGIWRVDAVGGPLQLFSRAETAIDLSLIPDGSGDLVASIYRYTDHIELYDLNTRPAQSRSTITSSVRDLYADACPDAGHPAFVSLRSRSLALWFIDGPDAEARVLPLPAGTPEPPSCSPDGRRYVTSLRRAGASGDSLVLGLLRGDAAPRVIDTPHGLRGVSWSLDGESLIVSSDREGDWDLWRFDPGSGAYARLTHDGGRFGREVQLGARRWLYYTRLTSPGLWRRPLDGAGDGAAEQVLDDLQAQDWGNWQWQAQVLWRVRRTPEHDEVLRRSLNGADEVVLSLPSRRIGAYRSLAVDAQGIALLTVNGPPQADLMRIPAP